MDKRLSHSLKNSPELTACRLATKTWRADGRCLRRSVWVGRLRGGGGGGGGEVLVWRDRSSGEEEEKTKCQVGEKAEKHLGLFKCHILIVNYFKKYIRKKNQ